MKQEPPLSNQELDRYSRQIVLAGIGYNGQLKLRNARVCVVGVGGLGCPIATKLTAMGVGYLRLIDRDVVERSNLHRQHLYDVKSIGHPKVEVAAKKLNRLNPGVEIEALPISLNSENAVVLVGGVDLVLDGLDSIETRYAVNRACVRLKTPYVMGGAVADYGNTSTIIPGETPCLECFYPDVSDDMLPTCAVAGVHPSILGIVSSLQVSEATKIILGEDPRLTGRLLFIDLGSTTFNEIDTQRAEDCPVCGVEPRRSPRPLKRRFIEETCGRDGKRTFVITPGENLALNMVDLQSLLKSRGARIVTEADLGLTLLHGQEATISILKSGVAILKGINEEEEALKAYLNILIDGLGISQSRIH